MPLFLTKEFLRDLSESQDARFIRQVLNHTISPDGTFTTDADDHRYTGATDTWIRYVSRGRTAYRVIYIRRGTHIYLYRAGQHSIEDNLHPPVELTSATQVENAAPARRSTGVETVLGCALLKTTEAQFIARHLKNLFHVRHKEIFLVSPFVDHSILASSHSFGRFLDKCVEEDTLVSLITSTCHDKSSLPAFKKLEERGIFTYFLDRLHAKLYYFHVDLPSRNQWQLGLQSQVFIGSSNLTSPGLGLGSDQSLPNEELNCRLPYGMLDETRTYVERLRTKAHDFRKYESTFRGTWR